MKTAPFPLLRFLCAAVLAWTGTDVLAEQQFGVDIRTSISAASSTHTVRLYRDANRTPVAHGTRIWFVIDRNGDGVPESPTPGAILGPDDVLALEDVVPGIFPLTDAFLGRYGRNAFMLPSVYRNTTNVFCYLWDFNRPLSEVPQYEPPAGARYGLVKVAATPKPDIGNATWRVHTDVFADAKTVGSSGGNLPPSITAPPQSQSVKPGQRVEFTVAATGTPPLEYQWRKNDADIAGATNATYVIAAVTAADAGTYTVVVRNAAGSRTSDPATLTVLSPPPPPSITPPSVTTEDGKTYLNFSIGTAAGASYQIQSTVDLAAQPVVWVNEGDALPGTGAPVPVKIQVGTNGEFTPAQKFFRILAQ